MPIWGVEVTEILLSYRDSCAGLRVEGSRLRPQEQDYVRLIWAAILTPSVHGNNPYNGPYIFSYITLLKEFRL